MNLLGSGLTVTIIGVSMYAALQLFNPLPQFFGEIVPMLDTLTSPAVSVMQPLFSQISQVLSNNWIAGGISGISTGALTKWFMSRGQAVKDKKVSEIKLQLERKFTSVNSELEAQKSLNTDLTMKLKDQAVLEEQLSGMQSEVQSLQLENERLHARALEAERISTSLIEKKKEATVH